MHTKIHHEERDGEHRLFVTEFNDDGDSVDTLVFVFTYEGLVLDGVTGGLVEGTMSATYDEIERWLLCLG